MVTFVWGTVPADFDDNGSLSIEDLDRLVAAIAVGGHPDLFDLNADGLVNLADRDQWLAVAGETNLASGNPYLVGDANLDGTVDGQDFLAWNDNKVRANRGLVGGRFQCRRGDRRPGFCALEQHQVHLRRDGGRSRTAAQPVVGWPLSIAGVAVLLTARRWALARNPRGRRQIPGSPFNRSTILDDCF